MKRIIVEGMDATGKSTLIETLVRHLHGLKIVINEKGPEQSFNFWLTDQLKADTYGLTPIHDRFFYSELVYGQVLRGYVNIDPEIHDLVRDHLRHDALLIYARPPVDIIKHHLDDNRAQMNGVRETWSDLLSEYDRIMNIEQEHYEDRYVIWNWYMDSTSEILRKVERYLV